MSCARSEAGGREDTVPDTPTPLLGRGRYHTTPGLAVMPDKEIENSTQFMIVRADCLVRGVRRARTSEGLRGGHPRHHQLGTHAGPAAGPAAG